jgi:predicted AAA+ superfamily ATPase
MRRDLYRKLCEWKSSDRRKPLILRGARQAGKTHLLKEFGSKEYRGLAYFNFEEDPRLKDFFKASLQPDALVRALGLYRKESISPEKDLIIFDEIQACNEALNSLKYFHEQAEGYHIAAAGSLLGVALSKPMSFPVGKVNFLDLRPMSFPEFLDAMGESRYRELLESKSDAQPFLEPFHADLVELLKCYYFVGGMPEVVECYARTRDFSEARAIQREILDAYALDFAKHAPAYDIPKLMQVWDSIPAQLARENRKFQFAALKSTARARDYENAILWLENAGLIWRCFQVAKPGQPLSAYANRSAYKIYALDIGLLGAMARILPDILVRGHDLFQEFRGAFIENYVAQALAGITGGGLHYWKNEAATAEVDFLWESPSGEILPLEAKAGINTKSKSLRTFDEKFHPSQLLRTTLLNLRQDGKILNIPLYALTALGRLAAPSSEKVPL